MAIIKRAFELISKFMPDVLEILFIFLVCKPNVMSLEYVLENASDAFADIGAGFFPLGFFEINLPKRHVSFVYGERGVK